jgi:RimJ/RimL family protein N-acetyltransferase
VVTEPVTLTDGVVTLRMLRAADADAVHRACQDPLIARFVPIPQPYTRATARSFVESGPEEWERGECVFAIADAATDELLGAIARHPPVHHHVQFGYWLAPWARGRGVATRALRLIVDGTLETTDLVRLELYTHVDNDASGQVALRAGFEREGIRRAWDRDRDGSLLDAVFYVRLR